MTLASFFDKLRSWAESPRAIWFLFLSSVATRGIAAVLGGWRANEDGVYRTMAWNIINGKGIVFDSRWGEVYSWQTPAHPVLQAASILMFGTDTWPLMIFYVVLSSLAVLAFFQLAKSLFEPAYALLAALLLVAYPAQWFWGSRVNPHTWANAFIVINLWLLLVAWKKRSAALGFVIGLSWAVMSLQRLEYSLGFAALAGATAAAGMTGLLERRRAIFIALAVVAGVAAGFAPWTIRNYRIHDRLLFLTTNSGDGLWQAFHPDYRFSGDQIEPGPELLAELRAIPNEVDRSRRLKALAKENIRKDPGRAAFILVGNFLNFWRPWVSAKHASLAENALYVSCSVPLLILFVLGVPRIPWRDPRWMAVYGFIGYVVLIRLPFYVIVRFREAIMPLLLLVAMLAVKRWVGRRLGRVSA